MSSFLVKSIALSFLLFLQISLINTKSQLFQLKNDRIVLIESTNSLQQDEIFTLISANKQDESNNFWIKDNESYEFAFEMPSEIQNTKNASESSEEILDCGKVNYTVFDDLMGVAHRTKLKNVPEPDVLFTFSTRAKAGKLKKNFDVYNLETKLRKEKKERPRSVQLYNKIGNFWRIKGNALLSIECFRKALSISPTNSEVILNLARVLFHQGYLEDAIFLTRKSLEVHSSDEKSAWRQYFTLGEIFKKYGNIQESILHLRHALELSPQHDKIISALEELEKVPFSAVNIYTLLIILLLVLGVLIVMRYLNDDGGEYEPKREKIRFRGAMSSVSKVRVIRRK